MPETNADKKCVIKVTWQDGTVSRWDSEKGEWTDYDFNEKSMIIRRKGDLVGVCNFAFVRSIEMK